MHNTKADVKRTKKKYDKALNSIVQVPHKSLSKKLNHISPSKAQTGVMKTTIKKLKAVLDQIGYGLGIAANQLGLHQRVFLIDLSKVPESETKGKFFSKIPNSSYAVFISARITPTVDQEYYETVEACLSLATRAFLVMRTKEVIVRYVGLDGKTHRIEADGLLAQILQHEIDHTNGFTIKDIAHKELLNVEDKVE